MILELKNAPVRELIRALEKIYPHPDGRRVVIHYHHAKDTLPPGTLKSFLEGTKWSEKDLIRLRLRS